MKQDYMKVITGMRDDVITKCKKRIKDSKNKNNKELSVDEHDFTFNLRKKHGM